MRDEYLQSVIESYSTHITTELTRLSAECRILLSLAPDHIIRNAQRTAARYLNAVIFARVFFPAKASAASSVKWLLVVATCI